MTDYTYATLHDRTFFAEDASRATPAAEGETTTVAPPRTVGATITFLHPVTKATVGTLTTGASGWIDGTLTEPRVLAVTADGEVPIYSNEWVQVRGHGRRPVAHAGPGSTPVPLLLPGDWTVVSGARAIWTGSVWSRGIGDTAPVTPDPVDPDPVDPDPAETRPLLGVCAYFNQWTISAADRQARYNKIAAARDGLVVMNIESGPGKPVNDLDIAASQQMHDAGHKVLGYVSTRDGGVKRPVADVRAEIDTWWTYYHLDGIFLDEGEPGQGTADLAYYTGMRDYIKGKQADWLVAYNPGTHPAVAYYQAFDILMIVEHDWSVFLDDSQVADLPENRDYASKVWGLVHSIPDQATADAVLAKAKRLGYDYLTLQDTDTNATWHELLPAQWLWDVLAK